MGNYLRNAFRWSETVGPWGERPGHFNDAWGYWTDDRLGFFEFLQVSGTQYLNFFSNTNIYQTNILHKFIFIIYLLQLAKDLGATPVWVVNDGTFNLHRYIKSS